MITFEDFDRDKGILDVRQAEFSLAAYRFLHLYKKMVDMVDAQLTWLDNYQPRNTQDKAAKEALVHALSVWQTALKETTFQYDCVWTQAA